MDWLPPLLALTGATGWGIEPATGVRALDWELDPPPFGLTTEKPGWHNRFSTIDPQCTF